MAGPSASHSAEQSSLISQQLQDSSHNLNSSHAGASAGHGLSSNDGHGGMAKVGTEIGGKVDDQLNLQAANIQMGLEGSVDAVFGAINQHHALGDVDFDGAVGHLAEVKIEGSLSDIHSANLGTVNAGAHLVGVQGAMEIKEGAGFPGLGAGGGGH